MNPQLILWSLAALPLIAGAVSWAFWTQRRVLGMMCAGVFVFAGLSAYTVYTVYTHGTVNAAGDWLFADALSAFNLAVMTVVYCLSSAYAWVYFDHEIKSGRLTLRESKIFSGLWCGALSAMTVVLISNNLGIMWVGIEATTLLTAFLICLHRSKESIEATWKYIVICSIGVAFAFMGTLLVAAAAKGSNLNSHDAMLWTALRDGASLLDPKIIKAAFVFLLVGYGTKAGLTPMHSWLPDAHSQAPAPVSALFSGFMLNAALYCVMRYVPIVESATGNTGWSMRILVVFGLTSMVVAAAFILFQHDVKRLLAYSSVEHIGIIFVGFGLGGLGTFAALFHTFNHSVCKTLSFFAVGRLGQTYGSHDMSKMRGALGSSPVWGTAIFGGILALIGAAPFAIFMSEFQLLKAAFDGGRYGVAVLFLSACSIVFVGALGHAIPIVWGDSSAKIAPVPAKAVEKVIVGVALLTLLVFGLYMPGHVVAALEKTADVIRNPIVIGANLLPGGER